MLFQEAWHPNCFRCVTCEQPLVDMLYFYKDGNYYCGRHFGDTMYPRCGGCDELIFAKEYTRAEDKDWHLNHFCCFGCDLELGGHRYMVKLDQPYCLNCYMTKFARLCHRCNNKIGPDVQRISHKELHWHASPECFLCYECNGNLLNKRFIVKNDSVFCSSDCKKDFFDKLEQEQTYSRVQK
uniref:LIM zinc-binding domain-containing protein n=1 Tax=Plectus sambesii TaxID=2011161 RepID=A0A914UHU3_9BILA